MGERPRIRTGTWRGGTLVTAVLAVIGAAGLATATPATAAGLRASGALAATGTWRVQASPDITTPAGLLASVSCPTARACVGVGDYVNTAGLFVTLAEAWNGTSWRRQPTPNPAGGGNLLFTGVSCPSASLCEAVGSYIVNSGAARVGLAEQWNGRTWSVQPLLAPGGGSKDVEPAAVACATARFCEAVGRYENSSGAYFPLAEVWSGASWRPQTIAGAAGFQLNGVTCRSATSCEAVGDGSPSGQNAEIWKGQSWSLQSTPVPPHAVGMALAAVSCVAANMCEAVGDWLAPGGELPRALTLAEQWNGTSWSMRSTPRPPSATFMALNSVSCTAAAACEATGTLQQAGEEALAEAWNGRSWTIQPGAAPAGATSNFLSGVSCVTPRRCEAVGEGLDPSARYIGLAEVWNGAPGKSSARRSRPSPATSVRS